MSETKPATWRFTLLFGLLAATLLALGGRVGYLQLARGRELTGMALRQQRRVVVLPARPGSIFGRIRGGKVLLAGSRHTPTCYADPVFVGEANLASAARAVAEALGVGPEPLHQRMTERRDKRFAYLLRDLTPAQAQAVRDLKIPGVGLMHEWRRHYPHGTLAAHVLGFRRIDGKPGAGIELQADRWLRPADGVKVLRSDAGRSGRCARLERYRPPRDGMHVVLTLDVMIQGFLEQALAGAVEEFAAAAAMGVVMDPHTGEVLAMASVPTFDPNQYRAATAEQRRNRAVTDPYEPGSAFKPFVASGAVQLGKAAIESVFFCHHGLYRAYRGGTIRDFPGHHYGDISLAEIVIHSSNIGMAKVGELLGNPLLHRICEAYGFGRRSGVDLPGECPGRLVPAERWTSYATRRLPFGQGPIMVTALQLANGFSAIANGGELLRPWVIQRVLDARGQVVFENRRRPVRRVLTRRVARRFIDEVLVQVVERGTGKRCRLDRWRVLGKTGTAQIGGPDGYEQRAYTATFVAAAPAARPAVVCVISVYRPDYAKGHTGGTVAAPYVRQVLAKTLSYLEVPPDRPGADDGGDPTQYVAAGAAASRAAETN